MHDGPTIVSRVMIYGFQAVLGFSHFDTTSHRLMIHEQTLVNFRRLCVSGSGAKFWAFN